MSREISVKSAEIFPVIQDLLSAGRSAILTVTGNSMYPFLRNGIDSVELINTDFYKLSRGNIVLIKRNSGAYVLHRIVKKKENCFYIVGDNQQDIEGPLKPDQVVAGVQAIFRQNKRIECSNAYLKLLVSIWITVLPFRRLINIYAFYPFRLVKRFLKNLKV